jgi:hypothetical protein
MRSGGGGNVSSGKSEFLRKINLMYIGEWMQQQIVKLAMPFIG